MSALITYAEAGVSGVKAFMQDEDMPYTEWVERLNFYERMFGHYSGQSLEISSKDDKDVLLFPLRDNIFARFVDLHSALLWGAETDSSLVGFYTEALVPTQGGDMDADDVDQAPSNILSATLLEGGGYEKLREASRMFGIFGEVVVGLIPDPTTVSGSTPVVISPQSVIPIFGASGEIIEMWIVQWIAASTARSYGWDGDEDRVIYVEHWTLNNWSVFIGLGDRKVYAKDEDGVPYKNRENISVTKDGRKMIPYKYVHRLPIGDFGQSLIRPIVGLVEEVNTRAADMGDSIRDTTHQKLWVKNYRKQEINIRNYEHGAVIDLGESVGDMAEPEMGSIDPVGLPATHMDFLNWLEDQIRQNTHTAAVILGLDEGSQRSGETMTARALPTIAIINDYRDSWAAAFSYLAKVAVTHYNVYNSSDIDDKLTVRTDYNPILSRDREVIANIESILKGSGLRSTETSVRKLGDVRNVTKEVSMIEGEKKADAELSIKQPQTSTGNSPQAELPVKDRS